MVFTVSRRTLARSPIRSRGMPQIACYTNRRASPFPTLRLSATGAWSMDARFATITSQQRPPPLLVLGSPFLDLIAAKSKGITPGGLKLSGCKYGSSLRFHLRQSPPRQQAFSHSWPRRTRQRAPHHRHPRPRPPRPDSRFHSSASFAPPARRVSWHSQKPPQDPGRRRAYLKEARSYLRKTH